MCIRDRITRAYQAGATDFFVKATQWSLLAGRLRYLLRASRTRIELERSQAKLARAQDLARMGSFDWWRSERGDAAGPVVSPGAARLLGHGPPAAGGRACTCRACSRPGGTAACR